MTVAGDYIGRVRLGVTIGVAGSQSFVWPDGRPAGTYTGDAGADGTIELTVTEVGGDGLTVSWAADASRRMIGHPWRLLRDGAWLFGDLYVVEAEPADLDPVEFTVLDGTVEVRVAMVAPAGPVDAGDVSVDVAGTPTPLDDVLTGIDAKLTRRVAVFADDFDPTGSFTTIPLLPGGDTPRAYLTGATVLVVEGDHLGLWTIPASGAATAGTALAPADLIVAKSGRVAVAQAVDGSTVSGVLIQAGLPYVDAIEGELATAITAEATARTAADNTEAATRSKGDLVLRDEVRSETIARTSTAPLLALGTDWGGNHDDGAYTTPAPAAFTAGCWLRSTITPLGMVGYTDPQDGDRAYSEAFTWTGEGIGIWDLIEWAPEWVYDAAAGVWRCHLFVEITFVGDTSETIALSTSSESWADGITYPIWEMPQGVGTEVACWFTAENGDGVWELRLLARTHYGEADVTADGAEWRILARAVGEVPGSIESNFAYPWSIGFGQPKIRIDGMQVRDEGPDGPLLANPTAVLALAAGEGESFTDDQGNEWTPGAAAGVYEPTTSTGGGGAVDSVNGQTGTVVLDAADVGAAADDDARLTDTRTPTDGTVSAAKLDAALAARVPTYVWAATDTAARTTTGSRADDPDLKLTGAANTRYRVDFYVQLSGDATYDAVLGVNAPTGATCSLLVEAFGGAVSAATGANQQGAHITTPTSAGTVGVGVLASPGLAYRISGWVQLDATAGDVALYWGPNSNGGTGVVRHANSHLIHTP